MPQSITERLGLDPRDWRKTTHPGDANELKGEILTGVTCAAEWCEKLLPPYNVTTAEIAQFCQGLEAIIKTARVLSSTIKV